MKAMSRSHKKPLIILASLLVVSVVVLVLFRMMSAQEEPVVTYKEAKVEFGNLTVGVTESGSVTIGSVSQTYDLSPAGSSASSGSSSGSGSLSGSAGSSGSSGAAVTSGSSSSALIVENVLAAPGQVVNVGDPLLTLTADSIEAFRTTLQAAITSAELGITEAQIKRDTAALQAKYAYEVNKILNTTAQAEYDATIATLDLAVTNAQAALTEADERIAAIPGEVLALQNQLSALNRSSVSYAADSAALNRQIDTLQAESSNLQDKYDSLTSLLAKVKRDRTSQAISAKAKYDANMVTYNHAESLYNIALDGIDDDVRSAEDALSDAQDNLAEFDTFVGDGRILSEYAGTVTAIGYEAGDTLAAATAIATFQNAEAVTLSVSVTQDDISVVTVGDTVNIVFTAYPDQTCHGTVTAISSSTANSRSTTVSYPVTVKVTGDVSLIYGGMTGNVTFITKEVQNILYVSNKAIINDGTRSYVKKKNTDGTTATVEVETGFSDGYQVEISSGLTEGDTVLIESKVVSGT